MSKKKTRIKLVDITKIRFAPELEVEFSSEKKADLLLDRSRTLKGWDVQSDGSIQKNDVCCGCEFTPKNSNKLYWNKEFFMQLKEMLALIRCHRGKAGKTCGLHIHVNCKNLSSEKVLRIIKEWIHRQQYIVKKFNVDKARMNEFAKLLPKKNLQKLTVKEIDAFRNKESSWDCNFYEYFEEKYYSLNITHLSKGDYGTLEFRLFNATLNYKKLKETIYWVLNFIKDSLERE